MAKTKLKDLPLQEITLRKYELPDASDKQEVAKKFLLSLGLLQPGESRDILVDIFLALLSARGDKKALDIAKLIEKIPEKKGVSESNVRRQLRRLKNFKLVEKVGGGYRIAEFGSLEPIIEDYIHSFVVKPSVERLKEYAKALDN
jgi:hypothetical protein